MQTTPNIILYLGIFTTSLLAALFITPLVKKLAFSTDVIDKPETRKIHRGAIPRLGGIAIFAGNIISLFFFTLIFPERVGAFWTTQHIHILIGSIAILVLGIIDDKWGLDAKIKFLVQFAVATAVVAGGLTIGKITNPFGPDFTLGYLSYPLTVLWIVGVTNAINLSDGLDGLASGISLIVSITLFAVSLITGHPAMLAISAALTGSLLGFLKYNFNPAQIFMGDTGSLYLGFVLAAISIKGAYISSTTVSLVVPLIALGLPIFDTLFAIVRRMVTRMNPFSADAEHVHHKLLSFGLNQKQTVIILYMISILFGLIAFLMTAASNETAAGLLFVVTVIVYIGINRLGYVETILIKMKQQQEQKKHRTYSEMYRSPQAPRSLITRLLSRKRLIEIMLDSIFIITALLTTRIFLEGRESVLADTAQLRDQLIIIALSCYISFLVFGYYREMWRYINLDAIGKYVKGVSVGALLSYFALTILDPDISLAPSAAVVLWVFLLVFITGSRLVFNFYANYQKRELTRIRKGDEVLIYGAGDRGETVLSSLIKEDTLNLKPVGFIDDDPAKLNKDILHYTVLGTIYDIEDIIQTHRVKKVIVSSRFINGKREGILKRVCRNNKVALCRFRVQFDNVALD